MLYFCINKIVKQICRTKLLMDLGPSTGLGTKYSGELIKEKGERFVGEANGINNKQKTIYYIL